MRIVLGFVFSIILSQSINLYAADCRSTGTISNITDWNNTANWSCGVVPGPSDNVSIRSNVTINFDVTVANLDVSLNGNLVIASGYNVSADNFTFNYDNSTAIIEEGATLNVGNLSSINYTNNSFTVDGTLKTYDLLMTGSGGTFVTGANSTISVGNTFSMTGANNTIDINGDMSVAIWDTSGATTSEININDGGYVTVAISATHSSFPLNINEGGIFDVYGDFTLNNGYGSVNVDGDFTVWGNMTINDGADVTVGSTGNGHIYNDLIITNNDTEVDNTQGGTWTVDGDIICPDPNGCDDNFLPVELVFFQGKLGQNSIILLFQTATEINNDYFTLEKSSDGIQYEFLAQIGGNGTTHEPINYVYEDASPLQGINYYRLSQTDYDGTVTRLGVITVHLDNSLKLLVNPNPVYGETIYFSNKMDEVLQIRILNIQGKEYFREQINAGTTLSINHNLNPGVYLLFVYRGMQLLDKSTLFVK